MTWITVDHQPTEEAAMESAMEWCGKTQNITRHVQSPDGGWDVRVMTDSADFLKEQMVKFKQERAAERS